MRPCDSHLDPGKGAAEAGRQGLPDKPARAPGRDAAAARATADSAICVLHGGEPAAVERQFGEEAIALAHGALVDGRRGRHGPGRSRQDQPVEKAAAVARRPGGTADPWPASARQRGGRSASAGGALAGRPAMLTGARLEPQSFARSRSQAVPVGRSGRLGPSISAATQSPASLRPIPRTGRRRQAPARATGSMTASIRLVLPAPLGPVSTTDRPSVSSRSRGVERKC